MSKGGIVRRVLIAYDGGEPARKALELGLEIAVAAGAEVGVVSVVAERLGPPADDPWSAASERAAHLYEAQRRLAEAGLEAMAHEPAGDAGPAIVRVAAEFGYDTVVIGSRRMNPLRRVLLGSVSAHVAQHAPATVIIAR